MATWTGWENEFLTAAQVLHTAANTRFLDEWASHAETNCRRNPVDLSARSAGSSDCHALPGVTRRAQNYSSHANAAHAFYVQLNASGFHAIRDALHSGDPFNVSNTGTVSEQLTAWGSQSFAQWYFNNTANAPGRGGTGSGAKAPHALLAWGSVRGQVNVGLPQMLRHVGKLNRETSRAIVRRRRVRG